MENAPTDVDDDDDAFLGVVQVSDMATRERQDAELPKVITYLQGQQVDLPKFFSRKV